MCPVGALELKVTLTGSFEQIGEVGLVVTVGAAGISFTVTIIGVRLLKQVPSKAAE